MKVITLLLFLSVPALARPLEINEAWDPTISSPEIMSYYFKYRLSELPLMGKVSASRKYWSGDYWPLFKGNINYRWYAKNKIGFGLNSPSKTQAQKMSIPELAQLAPSEKYDLYLGRYDYPLRNQVYAVSNPRAEFWEGICHGWSPATINHIEPRPKLLKNPDGIEIPFGSTDIKALLSYYYAYSYQAPDTHQMGRRCNSRSFRNREKDCINDLNAGAFHVVLTNRLGLEGRGFVADIKRFEEVWNHPITAYEARVIKTLPASSKAAPGTVKMLEIKTSISYVDENGFDWQTIIGTKKQETKTTSYHYTLELDQNSSIIGGEWISNERPDFIWFAPAPRTFEGILSKLGDLLDDE